MVSNHVCQPVTIRGVIQVVIFLVIVPRNSPCIPIAIPSYSIPMVGIFASKTIWGVPKMSFP